VGGPQLSEPLPTMIRLGQLETPSVECSTSTGDDDERPRKEQEDCELNIGLFEARAV
jgi:hypothetical protein